MRYPYDTIIYAKSQFSPYQLTIIAYLTVSVDIGKNFALQSQHLKYIGAQCFQVLQLLIYQSRHLGNDLGQVTGTELQMRSVGSFVNIGLKRLRMSN